MSAQGKAQAQQSAARIIQVTLDSPLGVLDMVKSVCLDSIHATGEALRTMRAVLGQHEHRMAEHEAKLEKIEHQLHHSHPHSHNSPHHSSETIIAELKDHIHSQDVVIAGLLERIDRQEWAHNRLSGNFYQHLGDLHRPPAHHNGIPEGDLPFDLC